MQEYNLCVLNQFRIQCVQVNEALSRVDKTVESLFAGLKERGVEDCVNLIIVSDHGMSAYNSSKLVKLNSVSVLQPLRVEL